MQPLWIMSLILPLLLGACAPLGHDASSGHAHAQAPSLGPATAHDASQLDRREPVLFPEPLRSHTLTNMRDHLVVLGQIQQALATGAMDEAARLAENELGMSSLRKHGAHEVARYMPVGMQQAGTAMHRSASRFALVVQDASVSGELKPVFAALAELTQACVACHAGYRLK